MEWPSVETFARRPRDALMWVPRAVDVARIAAALRVAGPRVADVGARSDSEGADVRHRPPRVADVGAGTGLLSALLEKEGLAIEASDASPPRVRYQRVETQEASTLSGPYDALVVSWMEAGEDYRQACAWLAPVLVNCYDVEGGCGVMGQVDFAPFGFVEAASWRTPSFEDAAYALDHRGALRRRGYPGNRVDILTREPGRVPALKAAVEGARAGTALPWEAEMDRLRL